MHSGQPPVLSSFTLQPYLSELRDLLDSVRFRLANLEAAAERWLDAHRRSVVQAVVEENYDQDEFARAIQALRVENAELFDGIEALLAALARVSLLLDPAPWKKSPTRDFTLQRGALIRAVLGYAEVPPLLSRELRNAWMHFDERLDQVIQRTGRWSSRHAFLRSTDPRANREEAIRLVLVDRLELRLPDESGAPVRYSLRDLVGLANDLEGRIRTALTRYHELYPSAAMEL